MVAGYRYGSLSVRAAVGLIIGGTLEGAGSIQGREFELGQGITTSAVASYRLSFGPEKKWFATGSLSFGAAWASTTEGAADSVGFSATDLRLGAIAGRTFADVVSPYIAARGFGGPISWQVDGTDITGSDRYHYAVGGGVSWMTPVDVALLIDGSVVGERGFSVAVAVNL